MRWSKLITTYPVFTGWIIWSVTALVLLAKHDASLALSLVYVLYLIAGGVVLWVCRKDLLAPPGLFTLAGLMAFGLSTVTIFIGGRTVIITERIRLFITDEAIYNSLILFLIATAGFLLGHYSRLHRFVPINRIVGRGDSRPVSLSIFALFACVVIVAGLLRATLHLGEAGVQPSIRYAGQLQYLLFDCVLLSCMWFLAQGLRQGRAYIIMGLALLLGVALTQALLGWRSGIIQVSYVTLVLFWYQLSPQRRKPHSLAWLLLLGALASTVIQLGNQVRVERMGGESNFATSKLEMVEKILHRSQGTSRLAHVVERLGPLTAFNDFMIVDLTKKGITTTTYVDRTIYGVDYAHQSHGVGTSGPGGPYIAMGMAGVLITYALLGIFYRSIYAAIFDRRRQQPNMIAIVLYAYMSFTLSALLSENFNLNSLKGLAAVLCFLFVFRLFTRRNYRPRLEGPVPNDAAISAATPLAGQKR